MQIGLYIILSVHPVWLQTHPYLKGNLRETWACTSVVGFPFLLTLFARAVYYTYMCVRLNQESLHCQTKPISSPEHFYFI